MDVIIRPVANTTFVRSAGVQGPIGPDGWQIPIQRIVAPGPNLTIDYSEGKHVSLTLTGNVTNFNVIGWPDEDHLARLTIEINNTGDFDIVWPDWITWSYGDAFVLTKGAGTFDMIALTTVDGGPPVRGHIIGAAHE